MVNTERLTCFTQKEIIEFLNDSLSLSEIRIMLNSVKLIGFCNAENNEQGFHIVKHKGRGYTVVKGLPHSSKEWPLC